MNSITRKIPRIIYNDDTCTLRTVPPPHSLDSLSYTLDYLNGTQVDCLCWLMCTQSAYSWPSKVMENFFDLRDKGVPFTDDWADCEDALASLRRQGIDYLPHLIQRAHDQEIAFIASFRLNDTHNKSYPNSTLAPEFWKEHQHYRLWGATDGKGYYNAALDYSYPEVRNRYRDAIAEVANQYEVDGIELDFTRCPYFFQPDEAWDKREILTSFVREIAQMLEKIEVQRGRGLTLILRIPCLERTLKVGGIDAEQWIAERLAPIVVISELVNNNNQNIEEWRALCNSAGVLLYPAVEVGPAYYKAEWFSTLPRNPLVPRHDGVVRLSAEEIALTQRAAAQNLLAQDPDGIYMFNFPCCLVEGDDYMHKDGISFEKATSVLSEMGSMDTLTGKSKLYLYYKDLPIYIEASRPRRFGQTISFTTRGADVPLAGATLRFHQIAERNPHADGDFEQPSVLGPGPLNYYLNDREINEAELKRTVIPAGHIRSGFQLAEHELIELCLAPGQLLDGENTLAFEMPHFPQDTDPYVYIYEFEVELSF